MDGTAFFYGILIHPKILKRIIRRDVSHLRCCPAMLFDFTRHRVQDAQYPGVVPYQISENIFNRQLSREEKSVGGVLVTGLTKEDIKALDAFEGDEYSRRTVYVHPLQDYRPMSVHTVNEETPLLVELHASIPAHTYIYNDEEKLEAKLWSFEEFLRDNAEQWF